jgi:hypothetical protein
MEDKKIILGLDVSTATIGICLMMCENDKNEIIKLTHLTPKISTKIKGIEALFLKKALFETEFLNNYSEYGITDVVIEEPLLGSNNINTVGTLLRFNGMISDSVYRILGVIPKYISSYDARRYSFPELMTIRKFNKKGEVYPKKIIQKAIKDNHLVLFGAYKWDIENKERENISRYINDFWNNIQAVVGGETGIDIFEKGCDKSQVLKYIDSKQIHFFGDRMDEVGNDWPLGKAILDKKLGTIYNIKNWEDTWQKLKFLEETGQLQ